MQRNKILAALALAGVCSAAYAADSSVTLYGLVDMGYSYRTSNYNDAVKSRSGFDSGQASGSRLGVRGSEELAPGISAIFTLEAGINVDTGESNQGGSSSQGAALTRAWGRQTTVGLDFSGTKIQIGRQFSPIYNIYSAFEPFGQGTVGQASNVIKNVTAYTRLDNSVSVITPYFGDIFAVEALYSLNASGNEPAFDGTYATADKRYAALYGKLKLAKRFYIIGGYNEAKTRGGVTNIPADDPKLAKDRAWDVLGVADFDFARFTLGYEGEKDGTAIVAAGKPHAGETMSYNRYHVGAKVPLGNFNLLASYNYSKDKQDQKMKAQQYSLGGTYAFSKRTDVYLAYSRIIAGDGLTATSGYDLGDGTYGNKNGYKSGLSSGIRVRF
ncbi:MAG: porin [Betaproteobacteria bacterium]|nr:porin [Betaproteobacteria bacterium]